MRSLVTVVLLMAPSIMTARASGAGATPDRPASPQAEKGEDTKDCVMQSAGADVLRVSMASSIKYDAKDGTLHVNAPQYDVYLYLVPGAKTVDEGIGRIGQRIKDQFKDFKATHTSDLTVAGSPARRLIGSGHEADDGDNGQADVIVFKVGDHIFLSCVHGEDLTAMAQQGSLAVVQSAQAP